MHSSPEKYFKTVDGSKLCVVEESLGSCMVGCYSTMRHVKQENRRVENKIEMMKRMLAVSGVSYDGNEIENEEKALMLSQFHDALSGSIIKRGKTETLGELACAGKICDKYIARAFFRLYGG